jgi:hypothetical protein
MTSPSFRRAVRARETGARDPDDEVVTLLEELAPSQREHYFQLRELKDRILENYRRLPGGRVLAASSEPRVDALLTAFLRLIGTLNSYRKYLNATDRKQVETELAALETEAAAESQPTLKDVKVKRVDILRRRAHRFQQAEESRELISHQLAGIEDLLRLTHEQSVTIRDPQFVSAQLDALTAEAASTEETVRDVERFLEFHEEVAPALSHGSAVPTGVGTR